MSTLQLQPELLFPAVSTAGGPTVQSSLPVRVLSGTELIPVDMKQQISRLNVTFRRNSEIAEQQRDDRLRRITATIEGLDECIEAVTAMPDDATSFDAHLGARADELEALYRSNLDAILSGQEALARAVSNLQLFFDTVGNVKCNVYWLNATESEIRGMPTANGRHAILDAGETGDGAYALLTKLDDTREVKWRASLLVLGDDLESRTAADFWAGQAFDRKLPVLSSVSHSYFAQGIREEQLNEVIRDLCGTTEAFSFLGLAGNHVITQIDDRKLYMSPAFAYAGILAKQPTISAAPIVPDEGRIDGMLALSDLQNQMSLEGIAPIAWLLRTTNRTAQVNLSHTGSNSSARLFPRTAFSDAIVYTHLARAIQHYLLTNALGKPQTTKDAQRVGDEIVRILKTLSGPEGLLQSVHIEDVSNSAIVEHDGRKQQRHELRVRFSGSTEDVAVRLAVEV